MGIENQTANGTWNSIKVYTMATICLLAGLAIGYLVRGAVRPAPASGVTSVQEAAQGSPMSDESAASHISQQQLKHMADAKASPILEQLKTNPKDVQLLTQVGSIYLATGQFDLAQEYFGKAVDVKATPDALTKLANAQYYAGQQEQAMATLKRALETDPKFANALFNLGMMKLKVQNDTKGAIDCWQKLIKTNPNHPQIQQVKNLIERARQQERTKQ